MEKIYKIKAWVNIIAITIGVILFSIGSILFLNPVLKMYFFGIDKNYYFNAESLCLGEIRSIGDYSKEIFNDISNIKKYSKIKRPEEYKKCIIEKTKAEKEKFKNKNLSSIVDGLTFIIVSIMIFLYYKIRKNKK